MKCTNCLLDLFKEMKKEFRDGIPRAEMERRIAEMPDAIGTANNGWPLCLDHYLPAVFVFPPKLI